MSIIDVLISTIVRLVIQPVTLIVSKILIGGVMPTDTVLRSIIVRAIVISIASVPSCLVLIFTVEEVILDWFLRYQMVSLWSNGIFGDY